MFSIIMPAYNEEKNIEEAIRSILNQSYQDIELLVVDDGSTDKTWNIIHNLSKKNEKLHVFSPGKQGKNGSINYAKKKAKGEWISFFAADDIMEPGILKKWFDITVKYDPDEKEVVIASRIKMFSDGENYKSYEGIEIPRDKNQVCHSGAAFLASRKLINNLFPIPENYPNEDGWTMLYFKYLAEEFVPCPHICVNYRVHNGNSLDKKADFLTFTEQFHKRSIVKKTFIERYEKRLNQKQLKIIENEYKGEMLRYRGNIIAILFMCDVNIVTKIRLVMLSNPFLYRIKLLLNRVLIGRTI